MPIRVIQNFAFGKKGFDWVFLYNGHFEFNEPLKNYFKTILGGAVFCFEFNKLTPSEIRLQTQNGHNSSMRPPIQKIKELYFLQF